MAVSFELNAEPRSEVGKGASRRLRRQGKVPAVLYGGGKDPESLTLTQHELQRRLEHEAFYSHVLQVKIGDRIEAAVLRDLQRHPYKPFILHLDLQRVRADEKVRVHVPLHFINEETSRGVKLQSGSVSHHRIEVEITSLPANLPEFIEVDLSDLGVGEAIHLSQLSLPPGVEIPELMHGADADALVVSIHGQRAETLEGEAEGGTSAAGGEKS